MADEEWRATTRHPRYEVSSLGRVRNTATGRVLKASVTSRGYLKVCLGKQQPYVHQLVAEAFHGPRPSLSEQVDHLNFDRTDNRASNLRWLPLLVNCVRWQDRTSDGRNVWSTPDSPPPEEHEPMSELEWQESARELREAGWVA